MTRSNNGEETRKRTLGDTDDDRQFKRSNVGSGKPLLKILVPNFIAGKLIGKGGSNISEIQSRFSASIQVSSNKEFYPGTDDRVVTISADTYQIIDFINYMIESIQLDKDSEKGSLNTGNRDVKIVVTNVGAGLVIGKGGATIKAIQEDCNAKIYISKREESSVTNERVLVVSGSTEQRLKACSQIIEKLAAEPDKMSNSNIRYGGASAINNTLNLSRGLPSLYSNLQPDTSSLLYNAAANGQRQSIGIGGGVENNCSQLLNYEPQSRVKTSFYAQMEIPDSMVGAILGKQGQSIKEFTQLSGAKIQFSPKDEFAPGTTDRILTIKGSISQIQSAYILIDQKVVQVEHDINAGTFTRR